jgi:hypothetical protein
MIGFHGTDESFETFSPERFGRSDSNSPNGALGVWVYFSESLTQAHGRRVLRIVADVDKVLRFQSNR